MLSAGLYGVAFAYDSDDSLNSFFLRSSKNLSHCFGCVNLRNKQYHIFNKPYSKEAYEKKMKEIDLRSYAIVQKYKKELEDFSIRFPRRFASIIKSVDVVGDNIMNSKNCKFCFDIFGEVENAKFVSFGFDLKDSYDGYGFGAKGELLYEGINSGVNGSRYKFTFMAHTCHDVQYVVSCLNSSYLFGCVSLRNKQYCILNKQYTKEEYEELVPKIIDHMNNMPYVDKKGRVYRYGEFFPTELSPFAYNETIAQDYFPLTKEQALAQGYQWKDSETRNYQIDLPPENLPDHIKDVDEDFIGKVIGCAHRGDCNEQCTTAFKITPQELQFYQKMNLPLPRLCPNCRHYQRLKQRNPLKLWRRACQCSGTTSENNLYQNTIEHFHKSQHCPNEFETSYAPDRPEIVYCEQCYQAEVV